MKDGPQPGTLIEFGPFAFDQAFGKLSKHGTPIQLRGMPLKILQHLTERPGEVVSRSELQRLLWNGTAFGDFEQGLNSAVNVVRKTLSDSADQPRYIETVPGRGYRFIAPLRSAVTEAHTALHCGSMLADANQDVKDECATSSGRKPRVLSLRSPWGIAGVLALSAFIGGGAFGNSKLGLRY